MAEDNAKPDDELGELKRLFRVAYDAWASNRRLWLDDARFVEDLDQWPEAIRKARSTPGEERPCLVVDKLNQYVKQVVNDGRQNRPAVKVRPVENGDTEVAEAFQGIIRHICDRSKADQAFDTALQHAVVGGFGFFRITSEFVEEDSFNQELCIRRIRNPMQVLLDPNIQEADGSDSEYGFVWEDVPKDEFKRRWPKAEAVDWEMDSPKYGDGWLGEDTVRVCEAFRRVDSSGKLHLLETGEVVTGEEYDRFSKENPGVPAPKIEKSRTVPRKSVKWLRMTGAEILEKTDWSGKYIPLIPVFGDEYDINGRVVYRGLIRPAKDAQRLYNFARSAFAERVALAPKAPWIMASESAEGHDEWQTANTGNHQALFYNAFDANGQPLPQPKRIEGADIPAGFAQDMQISEHDIQGALGMYNASLGERSNEKSGRAIMARQREGDTATFHFQDNQARAIGYLGRQLVDLIPKYWDTRRAARLLGEDGESQEVVIDPELSEPYKEVKTPAGEKIRIFNLNAGKYDVSVSAGPSYTTKRMEAADALMQLTQANPQLFQLVGDIAVRNMDWPGAEEIAERLKKMLPPQLQDDPDDELPPEAVQIKQQAEQIIGQAQERIAAAEQGIAERDAALQEKDAEIAKRGLEILNLKAEKAREIIAQAQAIIQQVPEAMAQRDAIRAETEGQAAKPDALAMLADALAGMVQELKATTENAAAIHANASQQTAQAISQANAELGQQIIAGNQILAQAVTAPRRNKGVLSNGKTIESISEVVQ